MTINLLGPGWVRGGLDVPAVFALVGCVLGGVLLSFCILMFLRDVTTPSISRNPLRWLIAFTGLLFAFTYLAGAFWLYLLGSTIACLGLFALHRTWSRPSLNGARPVTPAASMLEDIIITCVIGGLAFLGCSMYHAYHGDPTESATPVSATSLHHYRYAANGVRLSEDSPTYRQRVAAAVRDTYGLVQAKDLTYYTGLDGKNMRACNLAEASSTPTTQTLTLMCNGVEAKRIKN